MPTRMQWSAAVQAAAVCAEQAAARKVEVPHSFPKDFPMPAGTTI